MSAATILTLSNGKGIDLLAPKAADISFDVLAEHLAKENRYSGATPHVAYSVAQHCVIAADQAFADTNNRELAAYVLLHDGHEAFLKDDTTPKKRALAEVAAREFGVLHEEIMSAFEMLVDRFDAAIHEAAGLAWPAPKDIAAAIKSYDLALFVTEWRDLMRSVPHPDWDRYRNIDALREPIAPMHWNDARHAFLERARKFLPCFAREAA